MFADLHSSGCSCTIFCPTAVLTKWNVMLCTRTSLGLSCSSEQLFLVRILPLTFFKLKVSVGQNIILPLVFSIWSCNTNSPIKMESGESKKNNNTAIVRLHLGEVTQVLLICQLHKAEKMKMVKQQSFL